MEENINWIELPHDRVWKLYSFVDGITSELIREDSLHWITMKLICTGKVTIFYSQQKIINLYLCIVNQVLN
jgi:hypothetical protein